MASLGVGDGPSESEPPARVHFPLEEAPDLLTALEKAREPLIATDHLAEVVQIELAEVVPIEHRF